MTASGNEVQAYWGSLIATFAEGKDLDELLIKPGTCCYLCVCAA